MGPELRTCSRAQLLGGKAELSPRGPESKVMPSLEVVWEGRQATGRAEAEMPPCHQRCHLG